MKTALQLHIQCPFDDNCHSAPYAVVDGYVKGVFNLAGFVALALCRQESVEGVDSIVQAQRMFEFMVCAPENGSVILPLDLRNIPGNMRVPAQTIMAALFVVLSAISSGRDEGLKLLDQLNIDERAAFVSEVARLTSKESSRSVSLDFKEGSVSFSPSMALSAAARLKVFEIDPDEEVEALFGEFVAVDTCRHEIVVCSLETREHVVCTYFPEAFDSCITTPGSPIRLIGKSKVDEGGSIVSMSDVRSMVRVDLSPIVVEFLGKKISFDVELDRDTGQYYWAVRQTLGVEVFAETRSALEREILESLNSSWEQLASLDDSQLDESALSVKRALLNLAKGAGHDA